MALPLEGKVAVVTGSTRGIGKAIALQLAADGCDVVVSGRSLESSDEYPGSIGETAEAVRRLGRRALPVQCDVTVDADLQRLVDEALAAFGRIDILVNNAGVMGSEPFPEGDVAALERALASNVRAPFVLTQLVARHMVDAGGGMVVNVSSGAAGHPPPPGEEPNGPLYRGGPEYPMSKAALDRFTTAIAQTLREKNVGVASIWPGYTWTERMARRPAPGMDASRALPMETTAKAVAFLCREPMRHSGGIFTSRAVVEENGL